MVFERAGQYRRRLLHGRTRNDCLGCGLELSLRKPRSARAHGVGRFRLSIRNSGHALVLDRCNSRDAVSGVSNDAVLLHFKNPLGARLFEVAIRRIQPRVVGGFFCLHDRPDERRQHVRYGQGHANCFGLAALVQHMDFISHCSCVRKLGRIAFGNFQ